MDRREFLALTLGLVAFPWRLLDNAPIAKTRLGELRGVLENGIRVFRGVPFAKPPIGPLRFKPPEPVEPWAGTRDATKQAAAAVQPGRKWSEDCLYLNVWAPADPGPHPVLVWIHGGGNEGGGTAGSNGSPFVQDGIVVVFVAYRLGAFGFLELGDLLGKEYAGSGDNGIRDLEAALRWVHENIHAFGGDPSKVTIAGQSAGAKDVAALTAARSAKGLFSRAIMESGSGQTVHAADSAREVARGVVEALGGEPRRLLSATAEELLAAQEDLDRSYPHDFPFRPFVGGTYLPRRPVDLVGGQVPLLLGTNRDESIAFMARADADEPIRSREVTNLPFSAIHNMEERYRSTFPDESNLDRRVRLLTAEEYWIPSVRFAEAHSRRGGATWMCRFDHTPNDPRDPHFGFAAHASELDYVWKRHPGWTMHQTWAAFVHGKNPSWPKYEEKSRATLIYGQQGETAVEDDPRSEERRLWDGLL